MKNEHKKLGNNWIERDLIGQSYEHIDSSSCAIRYNKLCVTSIEHYAHENGTDK